MPQLIGHGENKLKTARVLETKMISLRSVKKFVQQKAPKAFAMHFKRKIRN
jgi:hypothetical protein